MRVIGKRGGRADYHLKGAPFDVEACCLVKDHSVWGTAVRKKPRFGYLGPVRALEHAQSKVQLWREVTRVINFLILTWGPSQMIPWCLGSMKLPKKSIFSTLGGRDCILNHFWGDAGNGGRACPRGPKAFKDDLWAVNHLQTPSCTFPKVFARSSVSFHGSRMLSTHFSEDAVILDYTLLDYASFRRCG